MKINKANDHYIDTQFAKEGDYNGRELVVQITNAGEIESQHDVSLNLGWRHNIVGNSGLTPFEEEDVSKGIFKIIYPNEMLSAGNVTAYIQIVENDKVINTRDFTIEVENNTLNARAIVLDDSFETLNKALTTVSQYDNRIENLELYKADKSSTVTQSEFDSWVATLLDGGPSIFMNTLSELKSTYPNGAAGVALVRETDPAKIYVWNGTTWEDFGDYQGIEVKDGTVTTKKLANKAVTFEKTDFLKVGTNLFNKRTVNTGLVVSVGNGGLVATSGGNSSSDFIPVYGGATYFKSGNGGVAYYDLNMDFISGEVETETVITVPSQARYMRMNFNDNFINVIQVNLGNEKLPYEDYYVEFVDGKKATETGSLYNNIKFYRETQSLVIPAGTRIVTENNSYATNEDKVIDVRELSTTIKSLYFDKVTNSMFLDEVKNNNDYIYILSSDFNNIRNEHIIEYETGLNLLNPFYRKTGQVINSSGELVTSPSGSSSFYMVPVNPNTDYSFYQTQGRAYYDKDKNLISYDGTTWSNASYKKTVRTTNETRYISMNIAGEATLVKGNQPISDLPYYEYSTIASDALTVKIPLESNTSKVERLEILSKNIDSYYPFNSIKVCNVARTEWGATSITYENETGFTRDGSNGDVMVEIPKIYFKRWKDNANEYISISGKQLDGYQIDPVFVENGKVLERIYMSAYEGYVADNKLHSISGVMPTTAHVLTELREFAKNKGKGYGLFDYRTLAMLQRLFVVYYANRNSEVIGMGLTLFTYQSNNHAKAVASASATNQIRVGVPNNINRQKVGQNVQVSDNPNNTAVPYRKITNIVVHENGESTITFSGPPVNVTAGVTIIASRVQDTGLTDNVDGLNGTSNAFGGEDGWEAVKFLGIENLWGNSWNELDGIALDNLVAYVGQNMDDYSSSLSDVKSKYVSLVHKLPLQPHNVQGSASNDSDEYIRNLMFDPANPAYSLPYELGSSPKTHYADPVYTYEDMSNMGAGEYAIPAHGGGVDHNYRAGLFTMRFWYTPERSWNILHTCRLIYKHI